MEIVNKNSLYKTLDNLNQLFLDKTIIPSSKKTEAAHWIAGRHGLKGSYANMFAPTEIDFKGIKLFTGDKLTSRASIAHILGEESLRALYLLKVDDAKTKKAISESKAGIERAANSTGNLEKMAYGTFCCGKCTAALWRNVSAEGNSKNAKFFDSGIKYLKSFRDGKGKWNRFPFFYTLLALTDINTDSAKEEMKYASNVCEGYLNRKGKDDIYAKRKKEIARRVLELI